MLQFGRLSYFLSYGREYLDKKQDKKKKEKLNLELPIKT